MYTDTYVTVDSIKYAVLHHASVHVSFLLYIFVFKIKLWVHPNSMFEIILKSSNHFHNALPLTYRSSFPKPSNHASGVTMDTNDMISMY